MRSITCPCDHVFDSDIPETIDLDASEDQLKAILDGTFMSIICPSCGFTLKPEFPVVVRWPSKKLELRVIPELDRADFYHGSVSSDVLPIVIGYPELADRIAVTAANLDVMAIEALKYYLLLKAEEAVPDAEVYSWFHEKSGNALEFHLHGLRAEEVAVSRVPLSLYERTLSELHANPNSEPFCSLRVGSYISVQNLLRPESSDEN